jgi:hypothetical protein
VLHDFIVFPSLYSFFFSRSKTAEGLLPNVDAVETVRNYVRVSGRELLTELYRDEMAESVFFAWLKDRLSVMVREFMTVLSLCFSDGYEGVERFLRAHLVSDSTLVYQNRAGWAGVALPVTSWRR